MKKAESLTVTDTNSGSCSSSLTNAIIQDQDSDAVTTQLSTDEHTAPDEVVLVHDKNVVRSDGHVESISFSSVEFVDIVTGK